MESHHYFRLACFAVIVSIYLSYLARVAIGNTCCRLHTISPDRVANRNTHSFPTQLACVKTFYIKYIKRLLEMA